MQNSVNLTTHGYFAHGGGFRLSTTLFIIQATDKRAAQSNRIQRSLFKPLADCLCSLEFPCQFFFIVVYQGDFILAEVFYKILFRQAWQLSWSPQRKDFVLVTLQGKKLPWFTRYPILGQARNGQREIKLFRQIYDCLHVTHMHHLPFLGLH
jgi:hypothetical protein